MSINISHLNPSAHLAHFKLFENKLSMSETHKKKKRQEETVKTRKQKQEFTAYSFIFVGDTLLPWETPFISLALFL